MTPEQFTDRNIATFTGAATKDMPFGVGYMQRLCRIGYKQACNTRDEMIKRNLIKSVDSECWSFEFVSINH